MFVSQAHSFRQQARLAITLAWVGGYTNILTFLTCGTATSHTSGTTSFLGRDLVSGSWPLVGFGLFLLTTFFVGAASSGFCTEFGNRRGWQSIFVLPIIFETTLLAAFAILLELHGPPVGEHGIMLYAMIALASCAMGSQNATITRISNGTVRTTHVTGVLTDLGHELTQFLWWLRDRRRDITPTNARSFIYAASTHPTARRLLLLASILGSFALGAALGTLAYDHALRGAMVPPVAFLAWIIFLDFMRPIAEIEISPLLKKESGMDLPASLAVYHLRRDHDRQGRVHRIPNLLSWAKRLPSSGRVVILDLMEVTEFDGNAAMEFRALISHFEHQGRQLILSGVTGDQYAQISAADSGEILPPENVCPDLELAVARGINLCELQVGA